MELNYNTLVGILNNENIDFKITKHKSLFTVKESEEVNNKIIGAHTKNLFLKNKKNNFFFVFVQKLHICQFKRNKQKLNF